MVCIINGYQQSYIYLNKKQSNLNYLFTSKCKDYYYKIVEAGVVCVPYSQEACEAVAKKLGKELGTSRYGFAGDYRTKGCYAYKSGSYQNVMFYGTEGSKEETKSDLTGSKYRPPGYDCIGNVLSILYI